jgi:putative FmdB family regulatory protein
MPTYEYECNKCHDRFEVFQSMLAEPLKKCKKCNGSLRRIIGSGAGIIFKGAGFYATDYRSADYKSKAKAETATCKACNDSKKCPLDKKKN